MRKTGYGITIRAWRNNMLKKLFLVFVFVLTMLLPFKQVVGANEKAKTGVEVVAISPMPPIKVEYLLPYPGILPDHPLYLLKRIRDTILDKLIVDPIRRVEFLILQGDKHLAMGKTLFEQKKVQIAVEFLVKGENYLEQAVNNIKNLKEKSIEVPGYVMEKITLATQKHIEVLNELLLTANEEQKQGLLTAIEKTKLLLEVINKIGQK